jgi:hypothetical protein
MKFPLVVSMVAIHGDLDNQLPPIIERAGSRIHMVRRQVPRFTAMFAWHATA